MSYTMTLDMPDKTAAYVRHKGPRFQAQLNSLFIAFVTTEMQREGFECAEVPRAVQSHVPDEDIVDMLSGVVRLPDDFDDKNILGRAALEKYERIS